MLDVLSLMISQIFILYLFGIICMNRYLQRDNDTFIYEMFYLVIQVIWSMQAYHPEWHYSTPIFIYVICLYFSTDLSNEVWVK